MKCNDIDIIGYSEGRSSKKAEFHVKSCTKCQNELEKLSNFFDVITTRYAGGKKLQRELDKTLQSINVSKMELLPDEIVAKVRKLKDRTLASKLKKVIGKGKKGAEGIIEGFLTPRVQAMPASPKDITRTKKKKRTKKLKKK